MLVDQSLWTAPGAHILWTAPEVHVLWIAPEAHVLCLYTGGECPQIKGEGWMVGDGERVDGG